MRGAVVDVFEHEPLRADNPLWSHLSVVVTPHMVTMAAFPVVVQQVLRNVAQLEAGGPFFNAVDMTRGY